LHLDLPRLGALDATLSFDAAGVRVRLKAAQASSAETLQDNRASLRAALADAGLPSVDIAVARHGQG
jgi:flagellar hook-length control protein FliK